MSLLAINASLTKIGINTLLPANSIIKVNAGQMYKLYVQFYDEKNVPAECSEYIDEYDK